MLYCGLGRGFHEIRHQNIHQPLTGKVAGMDTNVILPQLLEFLQAKDLALFRFFPVALCQALGDNLLPFLQEFLRVLEVIVLSVKVPLTLILEKSDEVPYGTTGGLDTV